MAPIFPVHVPVKTLSIGLRVSAIAGVAIMAARIAAGIILGNRDFVLADRLTPRPRFDNHEGERHRRIVGQ